MAVIACGMNGIKAMHTKLLTNLILQYSVRVYRKCQMKMHTQARAPSASFLSHQEAHACFLFVCECHAGLKRDFLLFSPTPKSTVTDGGCHKNS